MFFIALVALFQYTMIWVIAKFISFWLHFWYEAIESAYKDYKTKEKEQEKERK